MFDIEPLLTCVAIVVFISPNNKTVIDHVFFKLTQLNSSISWPKLLIQPCFLQKPLTTTYLRRILKYLHSPMQIIYTTNNLTSLAATGECPPYLHWVNRQETQRIMPLLVFARWNVWPPNEVPCWFVKVSSPPPFLDPQDENKIGIDGIQQFCDDLSLDPASITVLVVAWKFRAATQCEFTKKEFLDGMTELGWVSTSTEWDINTVPPP